MKGGILEGRYNQEGRQRRNGRKYIG